MEHTTYTTAPVVRIHADRTPVKQHRGARFATDAVDLAAYRESPAQKAKREQAAKLQRRLGWAIEDLEEKQALLSELSVFEQAAAYREQAQLQIDIIEKHRKEWTAQLQALGERASA